jgi:hypothetical protein
MAARAMEGTCLATLVRMAIPLCQAAERACPRTGPGRPPEIPDWAMTVLIMVAVLRKKKSKSDQYRFIDEHRAALTAWLKLTRFPSRSTYFDRYRRVWKLFEAAIRLQGRCALREGLADARNVAVDKSLIAALGPPWHQRYRRAGEVPEGLGGIDRDSSWVQGYRYEVVVTATTGSMVFPLLASADTACVKEYATFGRQIEHLPEATRHVLADSGYDKNEYGERIEHDEEGRRTGRHFICPPNVRNAARCRKPPACPRRRVHWERRQRRIAFYRRAAGRRLFRRRGQTVEPFNDWFKKLFELDHRVWHRGLDNNRTQLLAAIFGYQLLVRYNHRRGHTNGQITWIVDRL